MESKDKIKSLRKLSLSIGNFIRYWGFRRIHGAIWTQLYLSKTPLSCTDLAKRLNLSKSLVSPALEELCEHKLIKEAPAPNEKSKVYYSVEDINGVIQHVLKNREALMLKQISEDFSKFRKTSSMDDTTDEEKIESLGKMIVAANIMLEIMLVQKDFLTMPMEMES